MRLFLALLALLLPAAASCEWKEVTSDHFIIYANDPDSVLKRHTEQLEAIHYLMLRANGKQDDPSPVRVKVYFFGDIPTVAKLSGNPDAAGYYTTARSGAIAVVPAKDYEESANILYHEYAHHFMLQYFPGAYPAWYIEGWAELIGATSFDQKGVIGYGKANNMRKGELDYFAWTSIADILSKPRKELQASSSDNFYGQSWLLTHYLTLSPERAPLLRAYLNALASGKSQAEAASVFGDLNQLNKDVKAYGTKGVFEYKAVPMPEGLASNLTMRSLAASEIDLMKEDIQFRTGVNEKERPAFLEMLKKETAKFSDDPYAQQLLGEAMMTSEDYDGARAIADRLVGAPNPSSRAYWLKAEVEMHFAQNAEDRKAAVTAAREWIGKANKANPDDPLPLISFFDSFAVEGRSPNKLAITGLQEASRRMPQNSTLRFKLAAALAARGEVGDVARAIALLLPIAHDPHGGEGAAAAQKLINTLTGGTQPGSDEAASDDAKKEGE